MKVRREGRFGSDRIHLLQSSIILLLLHTCNIPAR
jgi:hypothetical protein